MEFVESLCALSMGVGFFTASVETSFMLQLQVINGKDAGKCVCFQQSVVRIGSDPRNDFQVNDAEISRHHGRLTCNHEAGHYAYCDIQSEHGTRVRASDLDVMLLSHQLPQSVALAGECMLSMGKCMIRCTLIPNNPPVPPKIRAVDAINLHALPPTDDPKLLSYLLKVSTTLTKKTTHHSVFQQLAHMIMTRLTSIHHIAFWRFDSSHNSFSCIDEHANSQTLFATLISQQALKEAFKTHNASLYRCDNSTQSSIVVPIVTTSQELGAIVADSETLLSHDALETTTRIGLIASFAIERIFVNADLSTIFDGFVRAIISVMDARDPASAGHSMRVSHYAILTAQAIQTSQKPAFKNIAFSPNHLDELRFASLLHDIGKVVLRREILLKAGKLSQNDLEHLLERIDLFAAWFRTQSPEKLGSQYRTAEQFDYYREMVTRLQQVQTKASQADIELIEEMAHTYITPCPNLPLLKHAERESLLIQHGTLTADERREIQRHALISWQYLSQISWPQRWANVPIYVLQHHEKLNGKGYPYGISGDQIFLQSRIITVCDIFDALTGGDRPYKTRHSFGDAAAILQAEVQQGALDGDVVELFIDQVIPQISNPEEGLSDAP